MSLLTGRPAGDTGDTGETTDPEALFKEAKRRERRRRALIGVAVAAAVSLGAVILVVSSGRTAAPPAPATGVGRSAGPVVHAAAFAHHGLLAFVSSGALWVLDGSDGSLRRVTTTGAGAVDPVFSPDGRWLAYLVAAPPGPDSGGAQLWLARSDGTGARPVRAVAQASDLSWSPTADVLAAIESPADTTANSTPEGTAPSAVWLVRPPGTARMLAGTAHAVHCVWSPDGREIAFAGAYRFGSLSVVAVAGGAPVVWFPAAYDPAYPDAYNPTIPTRWLPGAGILFWIDTDDSASLEADGLPLYDVRAPAGRAVLLGTTLTSTGSVTAELGGHFAIVSGGSRYAWQTKTVEICAAASDVCTAVAAPASDVTVDPSWSPDGRTLTFVEAPALSGGSVGQSAVEGWYAAHSLWSVRIGGGPPTAVAGTGGASAPVWSGNGRSLLYEAGDGLWLVPASSRRPVEIVSPLFPTGGWPSYYAQVDWSGQFDWWSS
ncbi:MAG TPA: hypothetical protein VN796_11200 [Acidimicrobiales bacterium]|nr:hypothetical protein [Acidimicrobiales bacterium]